MARDAIKQTSTSPVNFKTEKVNGVERPVADEPHIGTSVDVEPKEQTVQTGFARGGTSRPPEGQDGKVEQLDNDGKPVDAHPGHIARVVAEEGSQAGLKELGGPAAPAGEPKPSNSKKKG